MRAETLAGFVVFASNSARRVFGNKYISARALALSFLFSSVYFSILVSAAYYLSDDEFQEISDGMIFEAIEIGPIFLFLMVALSFFVDFLSVAQTRIIVEKITVQDTFWRTIGFLFLDLVASIALFILTFPFVFLCAHYFAVVSVGGFHLLDSARPVFFGVPIGAPNALPEEYDVNFFAFYYNLTIGAIIDYFNTGFTAYHVYSFELIERDASSKTGMTAHYPFTPFLATNLITSVWVWISVLSISLVHIINLEHILTLKLRRAEVPRRYILYVGLVFSFVVLLVVL